ncbi:ParB/RepB/Spo0J family partition protein [Ruminococcus sp. HUN007]|uniref:ParB/RepB/Spo0J family partition protein n=1 Tax=Ruminococcus sp. HUN007 TaxID=1514668 RepID=UPI0005D1C550|nr:ParB/RepB/Spo0J family partition protein [Ruminococcus sp. HUN007]
MAPKKGGLGMGLGALLNDNASEVQGKSTLRISEIEPNRLQPRKDFDEEAIASLADSIKDHGLLQPIVVRPYGRAYQIVAGERRWRAARVAGLGEVPVVIKEFSDSEAMQIALIENLQRENLNPVEEALGYRELSEKYDMTQESIAEMTGRSRSAVTNAIRILGLPDEVLEMIRNGQVSTGHAKVLLALDDEKTIKELASQVADGVLTVRALENAVKSLKSEKKGKTTPKKTDTYFREMELSLKERLGRKVLIKNKSNDKGTLVLEFYNKDDLREIADRLADTINTNK